MIIIDVPKMFQPHYKSVYPSYSSGEHMEEMIHKMFLSYNNNINTDYIYLPIYWTSYYILNNYGASNMDILYNYLDTLYNEYKEKKFFTISQYDEGVFVKDFKLNLIVFSAGGGGKNIKKFNINYYNDTKGDIDIPLLVTPNLDKIENTKKDIFCSFMGSYTTHPIRRKIYNIYSDNKKFIFLNPQSTNVYNQILHRSIYTLCPRGYGYTSYRLFEAINAGSIPIYIWDNEVILPYNDIINWNDFAIVINSKDIHNIDNILSDVDIIEKQNNLNKVKFMFKFEYLIKYIIEKISS